ncbi:MAG: ATP-binding domain-containing protein, partial [Elusimicrobia bacterium]|nr:ATP-binding domain-containing protein [Elusimicrobiota bacterium]
KGLEFPAVFLTGLEDGLFPINASHSSNSEMEEERRLCYVGMTRAKQKLFITWANTRKIFGKTYPNMVSRFLFETELIKGTEEKEVEELPQGEPYIPSGPRIVPGRKVAHPVYGTGKVVNLVGTGEFTKVTVVFDNGGRQTFMLKYAPLEII